MPISPLSPVGTSLRSSSNILRSVLGIGKPIVPIRCVPSVGLIVAAGDVSESPYASSRGEPVSSCHLVATESCTAIPPPNDTFRLLKSMFLKSGWFSKPLNNVFTPVMSEKGFFFRSLINAGISRGFVINTFLAP